MRACQRVVDSREFAEWIAYDRIDPIGRERLDVQLANFMWLFAEANRDRKKRRSAYKVADFLPPWSKPPERKALPWQDLKAKAVMITALFAGEDN